MSIFKKKIMNKSVLPHVVKRGEFLITPVSQGLSKYGLSMGELMIELAKKNKFKSLFCVSAFTSKSAVDGLSNVLKVASPDMDLTFITGIDNSMTDEKALNAIKSATDKGYIFYQSENSLFNSNLYIFEGDNEVAIIKGTTNCSVNGMFKNVESFDLIEFGSRNRQGKKYLTDLKNEWRSLINLADANLISITDDNISKFVTSGIVPADKFTRMRSKRHNLKGLIKGRITVPKRISNTIIPGDFIAVTETPSKVFKKPTKLVAKTYTVAKSVVKDELGDLVWVSGPLKVADLNIPTNPNTNPTGAISLDQGEVKGIDQRIYFRNEVFNDYVWVLDTKEKSKHIERTFVDIKFVIGGVESGIHKMKLSHNTRTNTASYNQNNVTTKMSWGVTKSLIAKQEFLGKTVKLYKKKSNNFDFVLEIK